MIFHGPHINVTDLELSPIVEIWSHIFWVVPRFVSK